MENNKKSPSTPLNDAIKTRIYLAVPFDQKNTASSKGARYDAPSKSWYIDTRTHSTKDFDQWVVTPLTSSVGMGQSTPTEDFKLFLEDKGVLFKPGQLPVMDGSKHSAQLVGTKGGRKNVTYCAFNDESPAGYLTDHKNGEYSKWVFKAPVRPMEEQRAIKANAYVRALVAQDKIDKEQEAVSKECADFFDALSPASKHPYLIKKQLAPGFVARQTNDGYLVLPITDTEGKIWGLQTINSSGRKMIKKDSKKQSNFIKIAGDLKTAKMVIVAEGYSNAESIAQSIKIPVVAAIDAYNLDRVVREIQRVNADAKILVAGDNDHHNGLDSQGKAKRNTGVEQATIAAARAGIPAVYPSLPGEPRQVDFNDMFCELGKKAVHEHISQHTKSYVVPALNSPLLPSEAAVNNNKAPKKKSQANSAQRHHVPS
jgi:putative DNA primase/helicase